jgi:predicted metal-dependent peptidase
MLNNITKAKAQLVLDQPFFATLLLSMPIIEDNSVPTMATNGSQIRYNSEFMATLSLPETVFILAHETMHCVFQHMYRRESRDHQKWNIATDYVINDLLNTEKIGIMPKGGLHDSALVKQGKGTAEGVYQILPEPQKQSKGKGKGQGKGPGEYPSPGEPGGALDEIEDGHKDAADKAAKEADMKVKVMQAHNSAKMQGKLSAGIARLVSEFTKPVIDWKYVLRRFLSERAKVDLSYAKPKRRFMADDIYLPGMTGEKLGSIVVAVDCSGSVSPDILNKFGSEIKSIIEDTMPAMTHVVYFDSEVLRTDSFTADDVFEIHAVGGGGTAFSPIFKHIETNDLNPMAIIVLTDLECSDFGISPPCPVLWASTGSTNQVPFGEILTLK